MKDMQQSLCMKNLLLFGLIVSYAKVLFVINSYVTVLVTIPWRAFCWHGLDHTWISVPYRWKHASQTTGEALMWDSDFPKYVEMNENLLSMLWDVRSLFQAKRLSALFVSYSDWVFSPRWSSQPLCSLDGLYMPCLLFVTSSWPLLA